METVSDTGNCKQMLVTLELTAEATGEDYEIITVV
jgi:hypothetical protein